MNLLNFVTKIPGISSRPGINSKRLAESAFASLAFACTLTVSISVAPGNACADENLSLVSVSLVSVSLPKFSPDQDEILNTPALHPGASNFRPPRPPMIVDREIEFASEEAVTSGAPFVVPENIRYPSKAKLRCKTRLASLAKQLSSGNEVSRTHAATDISFLEQPAAEVVPLLQSALLSDTSKWVRRAAARSLGKIGSHLAVSALKAASNDRDKWVAHSAQNALLRITRQARR